MPIFIDSHELKGQDASASEAAMAHEADLAIQEAYDVKFLTYWFDKEREEAFCLVEAPSAEALKQVHEKAHGGVPTRVFEVDMDDVRGFLGRVEDPQPPEGDPSPPYSFIDSAFRVIMFTDMIDSTAMTRYLGDKEAMEYLDSHDTIVREEVEAHSGRIVKHTGDGFLASFSQVGPANESAMAIQRRLAAYNEEHPDRPILVRIGLNAGVPVDRSGDLFGITVNLGARICAEADAGQILAAGIIQELCDDTDLLPTFRDYGRVKPKGFLSAVSLYEIDWNEA